LLDNNFQRISSLLTFVSTMTDILYFFPSLQHLASVNARDENLLISENKDLSNDHYVRRSYFPVKM
jgi:hypothetical protein